jgi:hypothetical protein
MGPCRPHSRLRRAAFSNLKVLFYPGAALLSLGWYRNRPSSAVTGGLVLFWMLYLLGSIWKDSPLTFASIIVLMYSLTLSARPK